MRNIQTRKLANSLRASKTFGFNHGGRKTCSHMMKSYYCRNQMIMILLKDFRLKNESFLWLLYLFWPARRIKLNIISVVLYFGERETSKFNITRYTLDKTFHVTLCEWTMIDTILEPGNGTNFSRQVLLWCHGFRDRTWLTLQVEFNLMLKQR